MTVLPYLLAMAAGGILAIGCFAWAGKFVRLELVHEWDWALLFRGGRFARVAEPGRILLLGWRDALIRLDRRGQQAIVPGQEILTADGLPVRVSVVVDYRVADGRAAVETLPVQTGGLAGAAVNAALHVAAQLALRAAVVETKLDDLLAARDAIGERMLAGLREEVARAGLEVTAVRVRDVTLPKELREAYAAEATARKRAQGLLEQTRGESAALRNLANAARLARDNPELVKLRAIHAVEQGKGRHTVVLDLASGQRPAAAPPPGEPKPAG